MNERRPRELDGARPWKRGSPTLRRSRKEKKMKGDDRRWRMDLACGWQGRERLLARSCVWTASQRRLDGEQPADLRSAEGTGIVGDGDALAGEKARFDWRLKSHAPAFRNEVEIFTQNSLWIRPLDPTEDTEPRNRTA
ncbi:hypothetical protein ACLOJK_040544 [Asimina triloba]